MRLADNQLETTGLMQLDTDRNGSYETDVCCIELTVPVNMDVNAYGGYFSYDWNTYQPSRASAPYWNMNKAKVAWLLGQSYPQVSADDILKSAGVDPTLVASASFTRESLVVAATQAAV
ncbi:hypothetical protein [Mobilicoccus pelagius]|uniref:Uncharacterized protein n=1 Tax=Mobilicoccus pelagius NBRC 104925 TaxID=1089455 RepID=H5URH2_9MICO|nr:hypothetical protein [Mobilicoccus pelagius]GAB48330.1 hypothetical protein MOPEL_071_00460 [Mobilicoccus pelagius NBRC 104925]